LIANFAGAGQAQAAADQHAIDPVKADTFTTEMFTRSATDKAYAYFVRGYDAEHPAQHPRRKLVAMALLVSKEIPEGKKTRGYSFRPRFATKHDAR
jgi:hypothetical protein